MPKRDLKLQRRPFPPGTLVTISDIARTKTVYTSIYEFDGLLITKSSVGPFTMTKGDVALVISVRQAMYAQANADVHWLALIMHGNCVGWTPTWGLKCT